MTIREDWLKTISKQCRHKVVTRGDYEVTGKHGNLMCGQMFPLGVRCMFKKCPIIKGVQERSKNVNIVTVYIASPYTKGDAAENVRRQIEAAEKLVELGYMPYLPLLNHFWHHASPHDYEYWMRQAIFWMQECDAVLRLSGESSGADKEVKLAQELGKPVFFDIDEVPARFPNLLPGDAQ